MLIGGKTHAQLLADHAVTHHEGEAQRVLLAMAYPTFAEPLTDSLADTAAEVEAAAHEAAAVGVAL